MIYIILFSLIQTAYSDIINPEDYQQINHISSENLIALSLWGINVSIRKNGNGVR